MQIDGLPDQFVALREGASSRRILFERWKVPDLEAGHWTELRAVQLSGTTQRVPAQLSMAGRHYIPANGSCLLQIQQEDDETDLEVFQWRERRGSHGGGGSTERGGNLE